jgi:hypothetical protein
VISGDNSVACQPFTLDPLHWDVESVRLTGQQLEPLLLVPQTASILAQG